MIRLVFASILFVLFFSSCTKDSNTISPNDSSKMGSLLLKIDKENAPSNVTTVTAKLTRTGFSTITSTMNILSDSSAALQMSNIAVGTWALTVEASDNQNIVRFRGVAQVTVSENVISNVNLVLNPVASGVGTISIFVTWNTGVNPSSWIDFLSNPILTSIFNSNLSSGLFQPVVFIEGTTYHMWFVEVFSGGVSEIYHAISENGLVWQRNLTTPVLTRGDSGTWDSHSVQPGAVIKDGNVFKMYYLGYSNQSGPWKIGMATSTDLINWTKLPEPVFSVAEERIAASAVIKVNNAFHLYYTKFNPYGVYLATSSDGLNWTRFGNGAVLSQSQSWETQGIYEGNVIFDGNEFIMAYMNVANTAFGYATSPDGKVWQKYSGNPIFTKSNTTNYWANYQISYPCLIKTGEELKIYYSGGSSPFSFKIGLVRKIQ